MCVNSLQWSKKNKGSKTVGNHPLQEGKELRQ